MSLVRIDSATTTRTADGPVEAHLDAPADGYAGETYAFPLNGWVLGREGPVLGVEVTSDREVYRQLAADVSRPDVGDAYPDLDGASRCGFSTNVSTLGLPATFELFVRAVLPDDNRQTIGVVRGRHAPEGLRADPGPSPILLITYGRTGSTWLMRLLGLHPELVTYRPFEFEPRVLSYWMKALLALSEPVSYVQALASELSSDRWWLGDSPVAPMEHAPDASVLGVLGRDGIEDLARLATRRVAATYREMARLQGRERFSWFCEKCSPERSLGRVIDHVYGDVRRIYLVRDPRDMILSILAYNERRHTVSFGRERATSDDAFVDHVRRALEHMLDLLRAEQDGRAVLVRYEDLLADPGRELLRIYGELAMAPPAVEVQGLLDEAARTAPVMVEHRTSADNEASVERWRRELPTGRQEAWTASFEPILAELDYSLDV